MLNSVITTDTLTFGSLFICTIASIILGLGVSFIYMYKNSYSKNFVISLALLPAMVQIVIMIVNGNLGTGVAVMGAFSLVRFRSIPGSARDIVSIFLSMVIGLATGMGCIGIAFLFLVTIGIMTIVLNSMKFGEQGENNIEKQLKIIMPENVDFNGLFDDIFDEYTQKSELIQVKTTNMGSLYELRYNILIKDPGIEKKFLDNIRCRNGNLSIVYGRVNSKKDEL